MFDGIHAAVGNFYSFIQRDKRGLQTEGKKAIEYPENCPKLIFFCSLLFFWTLALIVTVVGSQFNCSIAPYL